MQIKIALLSFCLTLLSISKMIAEITPNERQIIESAIERFHFSEAATATHALSDEAYREFYRCNILVYKYFSSQNQLYADTFDNVWKPSIKLIEKLPLKDELRTVLLADLYGKRAAMEFLQQNYFTALRMTRTCRKLALRNQENYPENVEQLKFLGLFNVIFASVPKKYLWLTNLLGYKGDMKLGLEQLRNAAKGSRLLKMEVNLIAYYVEKNILGKPQLAIERVEKERERIGESILLDFLLASTYCNSNRNQEAIGILNKRNYYFNNSKVFFITYWDHGMAKVNYYGERYDLARKQYARFVANHKGDIYQMDANFRIGMCYLFLEKDSQAQVQFAKCKAMKASPFDEDEYAKKMATNFAEALPNEHLRNLFRARNLFDGGYFQKAIAVLEKMESIDNQLSTVEKIELYYRFGRIYHATGKLDLAIVYYEKSTQQAELQAQRWMQVYSRFYVAEIARQRGETAEARTHYKRALKYDDYSYQSGLENRAKAALGAMK